MTSREVPEPLEVEDVRRQTVHSSFSHVLGDLADALHSGALVFDREFSTESVARPTTAIVPASAKGEDDLLVKSVEERAAALRRLEVYVMIGMVSSGALTSFFNGMVFQLSPAWSSGGSTAFEANIVVTYVLALLVFTFEALASGLTHENRSALQQRLSCKFMLKLAIPSALDVFITGLAMLAVAFAQPALVSILKATVQVLSIALISRFILHKKQKWSVWCCLYGVVVGVTIIFVNVLCFKDGGHKFAPGNQALGVLMACVAGGLGAARNLLEAALLDDEDFPPGALLLAESMVSALAAIPLGAILFASLGSGLTDSLDNLRVTAKETAFTPIVLSIMVTAYGKDAGKFWMIKYTSAQRAKVLALVFPFGTWAVGLAVFYAGGRNHSPHFGLGFEWPGSFVLLIGFMIILISNLCIILLKMKMLPWCTTIDKNCCC